MMTSFSPGANIRPAIMRTLSWIWALTGSTPRMGRLSKVSPAGINTCSASSGDTRGFPASSRLMAGRNLRASSWSSVMNELASESAPGPIRIMVRSEEHTSELQSHSELVCRLLIENKKRYVSLVLGHHFELSWLEVSQTHAFH